MNRIDTILEKERTNTDRIFLYLKEDRLMAFGYSAYFATWLFPELEVIRGSTSEGVKFVYIYFPAASPVLTFWPDDRIGWRRIYRNNRTRRK